MSEQPICHIVAGPNGSGKSTFALQYLPEYAGAIEYVNPDLLAQGMSPVDISLSALKAGKLALRRIATLIEQKVSFGFETTLSGRAYLHLLARAKELGYAINLYYLWMPCLAMLPSRIRHRVLAGGHDVPTRDVVRRYVRSRENLRDYAELADTLLIFDAVTPVQQLIWRRNGAVSDIVPERAQAMRADLGL